MQTRTRKPREDIYNCSATNLLELTWFTSSKVQKATGTAFKI